MPGIKVTAELALDDTQDPPDATVKLCVNGVTVADRSIQATTEWLAVMQAISSAARYDLTRDLAPVVDGILTDLDEREAQEVDRQQKRKVAKSDWQAARDALAGN